MERLLMNEVLFSTNVLVYLFSESLLFILFVVAFLVSIRLFFKWDFNSFTPTQFKLEQESYLVTTIAFFIFIIKFFLILYFAFTLDELSLLVAGAMCGAGVIQANIYGNYLLILKLFILFGLTLWFYLNHYDLQSKNYQWFKEKSALFMVLFLFIVLEIYLDFIYFINIDTDQIVSCCSALFGQLEGANPLPLGLNNHSLLILFYLLFTVVISTFLLKQSWLYLLSNILFLYISYYAVVYFFGTYIYQLTTHKCPFCMLQKEYYFVGYSVWFSLFIGSFIGINGTIVTLWLKKETSKKVQMIVVGLLSFFVILCSGYILGYYFSNGVWLS
jgi:hypothetical protein